jgi:exonuclease SbcD
MASFRFLHCADLHIDSPLRGLEADPDAPVSCIRSATRDAFTALVNYAVTQEIDFVLAAGDLYDGDWQDWRTGQFLVREVGRLSRGGIPFIAISGNHDARSVITRQLRLPEPAYQMQASKAETWSLPDLDVAIHGQSFATPAVLEDLTKNYPPPRP